jgi:hypothetical protein
LWFKIGSVSVTSRRKAVPYALEDVRSRTVWAPV